MKRSYQKTALDIARHIARAVTAPRAAGEYMLAYFNSGVYEDRSAFRPLRLGTGLTGILLHLLVLECVDACAAIGAVDRYVESLCADPGTSPTLFGGWSGVHAVLRTADCSGRLDRQSAVVRNRLRSALHAVPRAPSGEPYDELVGGLAGIAIIDDPLMPELAAVRGAVAAGAMRYGAPNASDPAYFLGVAHGIAGVIPPLLAGGSQYFDVVRHLCDALIARHGSIGRLTVWPRSTADAPAANCSWCHGAAGIAAVLFRAGSALADARIAAFGLDTMLALAQAGVAGLEVNGDCICHGWAGILLCAQSIGDPRLDAFAEAIFVRLTGRFNRLLPFGFSEGAHGGLVSIAFLDGAVGIALALVAFAFPESRAWTTVLGIASPPPSR